MQDVHDGLREAPAEVLDAAGLPRLGAYRGAPAAVDLDRASAPGLGRLDRPALRGLRRKSWRWVGVADAERTIVAAVVDLGFVGLAWACVAEGERLVERSWRAPLGVGVRVGGPGSPAVAMAPRRLVSLAQRPGGDLNVTVEIEGMRLGLDVAQDAAPLTVVSDCAGRGLAGVTVKRAGATATGSIEVEGRRAVLGATSPAAAIVDWTSALLPRRMTWWWAAAAGRDADGRIVGLNLARGVHDDPAGQFTENALWVDGAPAALPPVSFGVGAGRTPWTIRSPDGAVDLTFTPRVERGEDAAWVVVSSRYRQPFGTFSGRLQDARGRTVKVDGLPGVTEHHTAVW